MSCWLKATALSLLGNLYYFTYVLTYTCTVLSSSVAKRLEHRAHAHVQDHKELLDSFPVWQTVEDREMLKYYTSQLQEHAPHIQWLGPRRSGPGLKSTLWLSLPCLFLSLFSIHKKAMNQTNTCKIIFHVPHALWHLFDFRKHILNIQINIAVCCPCAGTQDHWL